MNKDKLHKRMSTYSSSPRTSDNYVGVEIEFSCRVDRKELEEKLIDANLARYVNIGYDGNPDPGHIGYEFRTLVKQSEVNTVLPSMGKFLNTIGAVSNRSCGLHVHLDMRHRNATKVFNNLVKAQDILFGVAAKHRGVTHWCRKNTSSELDKAEMRSKHQAINPMLVPGKNTIEVRIREGIVDGDDMQRWVRLLVAIADSKHLEKDIETVSELENTVKLSRYVREYVRARIQNNAHTKLLKVA